MHTLAIAMALAASGAAQDSDACSAAKDLVEAAYVDGIWRNRDQAAVDAGFHPSFVMQARSRGEMTSRSIEDWVGGGRMNGEPNERQIDAELTTQLCEGTMAIVRVDLSIDGNPTFVDVFGVYQFEDGWKIVAKLYERV